MKSYIHEIVEKMKGNEYKELNWDFTFNLTNESDRGAILIGGSKVEKYLEELIITILPSKLKTTKPRLLNYPGPLSSFSGKVELAYAFRLIDSKLYSSLSSLRKIRNDAAHSSSLYSLQKSKDQLESIYDFEYKVPDIVHKLAYDNLIKWKRMSIKKNFEENNLTDLDEKKFFEERYPNPLENEDILKQLLIWELAYGLTFLCMKIKILTQEYSLIQMSNGIWLDKCSDINKGEP